MKDSRNHGEVDAKLLRRKIKKIVHQTILIGLFYSSK